MQLDQNPFFRKAITSWYDSSFACWLLIAIMLLVFVFSLAGVIVALGEPAFEAHFWFPGFLAFLSGFLALKVFIRLKIRSNKG
ncbi:MAG: hypothetical protein KKC20_12700 [Proteobacteria bacterium]|nr:hypothetical protein [Pseudomonadota bacterium]